MAKKKTSPPAPPVDTVGLIGLGLMGRGIATCLLANGLKVVAYNRTASRRRAARPQIAKHVEEVIARKVRTKTQMRGWEKRLTLTGKIEDLADCPFIIESVAEDLAVKHQLYARLESVISPKTVIASNTSSFPVDLLIKGSKHPERFLVVHWAEPAWITPFLEIIPGKKTAPRAKRISQQLGESLGKTPTLAKRDITGFIANRLMYAVMREACYLVESGVADVATVDRSFRNDMGCWSAIAGPFRWMDLTGLQLYATCMEGVNPTLSNQKTVPEMMRKLQKSNANGIFDGRGHYKYTKAEGKRWHQAWTDFTYDLQEMLEKYREQLGGLG